MSITITIGAGCGKSVKEADAGGSSFSKVLGKKDATSRNRATIKIVSIKHAIARSQNPANAGRAGKTGTSGIAGIISAGGAFCGTYTGPMCATLNGY